VGISQLFASVSSILVLEGKARGCRTRAWFEASHLIGYVLEAFEGKPPTSPHVEKKGGISPRARFLAALA
jgi:hypothetical protein